jgi:hypothetical protein
MFGGAEMTAKFDEKRAWIVVVEFDGNQAPSWYYRRLRDMALRVRGDGDKEKGVYQRRDGGHGIIAQEGAIIVPSHSLARTVAFLARDSFNDIPDLKGSPAVSIGPVTMTQAFTRSRQDAQLLNRVQSVLGKRGRKPKPENWVISCSECMQVSTYEGWATLNCPNCGGLLIHSRKGRPVAYKDPGGDVFEAWKRMRFAGPHWEPAEISDIGLTPPANPILPSKNAGAVDAIANSPVMDRIRAMDRETAFAFLDAMMVNRAYRDKEDRDRNRVETVIAFFKVCEDPGAINLTEKEPDLVDAAGALGTGKVVEWIYKFYVEAKEAQSA